MESFHSLDPRWQAFLLQILRLCVWLVLLSVLFIPLERLCALHPKNVFRKEILVDIGYYFLSSLLPSLLLSFPLALAAWVAHHFVPGIVVATIAGLPLWMRAAAAMLVGEIGFYWGHRWSHEIPMLWRFHVIHHSAEHLDFLVNTRVHPIDMVFTRLCGLVPMYILGLASPIAGSASIIPMLVLLLGTVWGFFIHANVTWRFGPLEWMVATPAFHHWHHANDRPEVYNKNYSPLLPFIDRVFGTHHLPAREQPATYGVHETVPGSLVGQLMHPFSRRPETAQTASPITDVNVQTTTK